MMNRALSRICPLVLALLLSACGAGKENGEPESTTSTLPERTYTLAINKSGSGTVSSASAGIACGADCSETYPAGTAVELTATPASGYIFSGWSGGTCSGTAVCTATMDSAATVTATFALAPIYTLTINKVGTGTVASATAGIACGSDCNETYPSGTSVVLSATPATNFTFSGWSGGGCTGTGTCTVTLGAAVTVTATFTAIPVTSRALTVVTTGSGTVTSTVPTGISCGAACALTVTTGTAVTLTAAPAAGYTFTGWSGGGCSGTGSCVVSLSANTTVTAAFSAVVRTLTVTRVGSGTVTSSAAGIACGSTCTAGFGNGTSVTLTAAPATGYTFTGWSGGCTGTGTCALTLAANTSVTATFTAVSVASYTVAVTRSGTGTGTVASSVGGIACGTGGSCSASVTSGTSMTLTATPGSGQIFANWGGACSGTATTCTLSNITAAANVTATFNVAAPTSYALTVTRTGSGTVTSSPSGISCGATCSYSFLPGTVVALTAAPLTGYTFGGWVGCTPLATGSSTCSVTVGADTVVQANFTPIATGGTQYIPLSLAAGPVAAGVPIRTGVPFPLGALSDVSKLRLDTGDGSPEVPAQFDVLARWPDGSIKAALLNIVTDLGTARSYRVAYGSTVSRAALPRNIVITGSASTELTVDAGLIKFAVSNKGLVTKVWRDANANGIFETGEQLIDAAEIFVVNAKDNLEYNATTAADTVVTVEESGPLRVVIKAKGSLTNGSATLAKYQVRYYASVGSDKLDVETTLINDKTDRFAGTGGLCADEAISCTDRVPEKAATSTAPAIPEIPAVNIETKLKIAIKDFGMRWRYVPGASPGYRFGDLDGKVYGGDDATLEKYILQKGEWLLADGLYDRGNSFAYSGVGDGSFAAGWVSVGAGSGGGNIAVCLKDFWQQFPGELNVTGSLLTAKFFSGRSIVGSPDVEPIDLRAGQPYRRPNTLYFTRNGGAKTYRLRLAFSPSVPTSPDLIAMNSSYQRHKLELMAAPSWYASSGVFGDINTASSTATTGFSAHLMKEIFEFSVDSVLPTFGNGNQGSATAFGWRDYGDQLRTGNESYKNKYNEDIKVPTFYNDTHIGSNKYLKEFVRTGDQRWYQFAEIATNHFMDIDVVHGPREGYRASGGRPQPPGEIHAATHANRDHETRNLHYGHAHVSGLSDLYLLTGDKRSYETLEMIAKWWEFMVPYSFALPFNSAGGREAERDYGWPLYVMNEWVRISGDYVYHEKVAGRLVEYMIQWWKTPLNHIGFNPSTGVISTAVIGVNDASNGTGWWTMSLMDNGNGSANGVNPWMAGSLIGNLIKFREQEERFAVVGKARVVDRTDMVNMLMQTMDYVVTYGYKHSTESSETKTPFVYSEVRRGNDANGIGQLSYPLAYLDRLYKQEEANGRKPLMRENSMFPAPNSRSLWLKIVRDNDNIIRSWSSVVYPNSLYLGGQQSYGFYGYEYFYPADAEKVISDVLGY